jgi:hypothetical protein
LRNWFHVQIGMALCDWFHSQIDFMGLVMLIIDDFMKLMILMLWFNDLVNGINSDLVMLMIWKWFVHINDVIVIGLLMLFMIWLWCCWHWYSCWVDDNDGFIMNCWYGCYCFDNIGDSIYLKLLIILLIWWRFEEIKDVDLMIFSNY